jgi:hypothetical protein
MSIIIRTMPASMTGELLSINTAVRLRVIPAQWKPLVTLGTLRTTWERRLAVAHWRGWVDGEAPGMGRGPGTGGCLPPGPRRPLIYHESTKTNPES